jgi:hypothetical protein
MVWLGADSVTGEFDHYPKIVVGFKAKRLISFCDEVMLQD